MTRQAQYRPSLSAAEIDTIISLLPRDSTVYKKLAMYQVKINIGLNVPAYIKTGEQQAKSVAAQVGLVQEDSDGENSPEQNHAMMIAKLEHRAQFAPQLMSPADRFELLGAKAIAGTASAEEIEEGKKLELELYGSNMGTFD